MMPVVSIRMRKKFICRGIVGYGFCLVRSNFGLHRPIRMTEFGVSCAKIRTKMNHPFGEMNVFAVDDDSANILEQTPGLEAFI
jgi:hypothetical protein